MRGRVLTAAVLLLAAALATPVVAWGDVATPHAEVSAVDYDSGTVTITVQFTAPVSRVDLVTGDSVFASVECTQATEASFGAYPLVSPVVVDFVGRDAAGTSAWECSITIDPATYRPPAPRLLVASGKVVGARFSPVWLTGVPVTEATATVRGETRSSVSTISLEATDTLRFADLATEYGRTTLALSVANGFGTSPKGSVVVYNLGTGLPTKSRYVLVSKRILWMFDVKKGRVIHRWPVAIGTPQTPTPSGSFTIGRGRAAGGAWGVLRRRLYRDVRGRKNPPTRYYIHGTNAPWSIGMKASHGCVRMYNSHVRQFSRVVPTGTYVRIR